MLSLLGPGGWWHGASCPVPPPWGVLHSPRASGFERQGCAPRRLCSDSPNPGEPQRPCWIILLAAVRGAVSPSEQSLPISPASQQHGLRCCLPHVGRVLEGQGGICPLRPRSPPSGPADLALRPLTPLRACAGALSGVTLRFQVSGSRGWWPFPEASPAHEERELWVILS